MFRMLMRVVLLVWMCAAGVWAQPGSEALRGFQAWKKAPANAALGWDAALEAYRTKLRADGLDAERAERTIRLVIAYDEAELYNDVYARTPTFNTSPNQFLVEAVEGLKPGRALDAGMGQGRNALLLAGKGWTVTGFDVAEVGLKMAREAAAGRGLKLEAVHSSDIEFDFGSERWDLIAIIHAMEKRSVLRVREALKPGGVVVVEAAHIQPGGYVYGFESEELLKLFEGFEILRYEERLGSHDFSEDRSKPEPLVRLAARKPR